MGKACLNCGTSLGGDYCENCGQRDISPGIRLKDVVQDFFSYTFSIEGPILQTLKLLVVDPGALFRSFIGGQRKSYYKPIQFFVITTLIYFALAQLVGFDPVAGQFNDPSPKQTQPYMEHIEKAVRFMVGNLNNFLFFLVIGIATVLKLTHRRRNTFAEYLTIGFYITGFYILVGTIDLFAWLAGFSVKSLKILFFFAYFSYAYASYLGKVTFPRILLGSILGVVAFGFYFITSFGLSLLWTSM